MNSAEFLSFARILPEACLLLTTRGEVLACNPAAEGLWDRPSSDLEGAALTDLVSDDHERVLRFIRAASRSSEPVPGALVVAADPEIACSCLAGLLSPATEGEPGQVLLHMQDRAKARHRFQLLDHQIERLTEEVHRRQEAELQIRKLLRELEVNRSLLEESQRSARVGSWDWDMEADTLVWSDEMYRIYGLDPDTDSIDMQRYVELLHPEDRPVLMETVQRAQEDLQPFDVDHRTTHPDGAVRVLHCRGRVITAVDGRPVRMIGSGQDITERKQQEQRTRLLADIGHIVASSLDYGDTLRRVADTAAQSMADWAAVDVIEDGELHRLAIAHRDPEKVDLAEKLRQRWPPQPDTRSAVMEAVNERKPLLFAEIDEALLEDSARSEEHLAVLRELGLRSAIIAPMIARDRGLGAITLVSAGSGRLYGEEDLELARELAERAALAVDNARLYSEAQTASRARDELMAMVSHDVRSPLSAITAGIELLLHPGVAEEKKRRQIHTIQSAAHHIERLTRDLLDLTRIDAGNLTVERAPQDVRPIVHEAVEAVEMPAREGRLSVTTELEPELPLVLADRDRVRQVLDNLLANAVRYTPEGGRIFVSVHSESEAIRVSVSDTGPGVPEKLRPHIFERYRQETGPKRGAAGLGLPIAKGLVEAHGGRMWLEPSSDEDPGATFRFTLPVVSQRAREATG